MKTNHWRRFFTEAGVISLAIVYSYAVYLFGEIGSLSALGISDTAALLTLDVQNILLGFLKASLYFIGFIFLLAVILLPVVRAKTGSKRAYRFKKFSLVVVVAIMILACSPFVYNELGRLGLGLVIAITILLLVVFMIRMPGHKKSFEAAYSEFLEERLFANDKLPSIIRIGIPAIILALILIPFLNYLVSYNGITTQPEQHSIQKVATVDNKAYWVARTYSDKYILVKLEEDVTVPSYLVLNSKNITDFRFNLKEIEVNTQKLHPKTVRYQEVDEAIKNMLKL